MLILIAGPYRSGTGDDPAKMAANLLRLEAVAWPLFQAGHVPMIGEWVALPVWRSVGGTTLGDELYDRIFYPAPSGCCSSAMPSCPCPASRRVPTTTCGWRGNAACPSITGWKTCRER